MNSASAKTNLRPRRIVLAGFMGSGKSTVGPLLAQRLGWRFFDADEVIAAEAGSSIPEIFRQHGEAGFREREQAAIERLTKEDALVLSLGGGALETEATRSLLLGDAETLLVHLEVQLETTLTRCSGTEGDRPVFADRAHLASRYQRRMPLYRQAHFSVATDRLTPDQIVEEIAARLYSASIVR